MPLFWRYLAHWKVTIWRMLSVQQNHGSVWALIEVFVGACRMLRKFILVDSWRYSWVFLVYSRIHLFFFQATFLLCASFFHNFHKNNYVVDGSEIPPATTVWMVLKTQKKTWNIYHINWCQESIPRMDLLGDFADRMYLAHGIQPPHHVDKPKRRKLKANTGKQLSEIPVLLVALWFKVLKRWWFVCAFECVIMTWYVVCVCLFIGVWS